MRILWLVLLIGLSGCVSSPPSDIDNVCEIFEEKGGWYKDAKRAAKKWNTDVSIIMAFIRRESSFVANAKPPRRRILWVLPGPRLSDAYGYAQAKDATWEWYQKEEGGWWANRHQFEDAVNFVGWYNAKSARQCNISTRDPYRLYLAYHEGQGGYNRGTYKSKPQVQKLARRVADRAKSYKAQLHQCEKKLNDGWLFF